MDLAIPSFKNLNPWLSSADIEALTKLKEQLIAAQNSYACASMRLLLDAPQNQTKQDAVIYYRNLFKSYSVMAFELERRLQKRKLNPRFSGCIKKLSTEIKLAAESLNYV